jgi:hypothetical protein
MQPFLAQVGFPAAKTRFVPVGAFAGVNLVDARGDVAEMLRRWYKGPTLVELLGKSSSLKSSVELANTTTERSPRTPTTADRKPSTHPNYERFQRADLIIVRYSSDRPSGDWCCASWRAPVSAAWD